MLPYKKCFSSFCAVSASFTCIEKICANHTIVQEVYITYLVCALLIVDTLFERRWRWWWTPLKLVCNRHVNWLKIEPTLLSVLHDFMVYPSTQATVQACKIFNHVFTTLCSITKNVQNSYWPSTLTPFIAVEAQREKYSMDILDTHQGCPRLIRRDNVFEDVVALYRDHLNCILNEYPFRIKFLGEKAVDTGGVCRDLFSAFWSEAYDKAFDGAEGFGSSTTSTCGYGVVPAPWDCFFPMGFSHLVSCLFA